MRSLRGLPSSAARCLASLMTSSSMSVPIFLFIDINPFITVHRRDAENAEIFLFCQSGDNDWQKQRKPTATNCPHIISEFSQWIDSVTRLPSPVTAYSLCASMCGNGGQDCLMSMENVLLGQIRNPKSKIRNTIA